MLQRAQDIEIELRQHEQEIIIVVRDQKGVQQGELFRRNNPPLDALTMAELRRGNLRKETVEELKQSISDWLFGNELGHILARLVAEESVRLVFSFDEHQTAPLAQRTSIALTEIPFELVQLPHHAIPLVIDRRVSAMIHRLPLARRYGPPLSSTMRPLRVLIVRSNPGDLGPFVPEAVPMIQKIAAELPNPEIVHFDLLSREQGEYVRGQPTSKGFEQQLERAPAPYDLLIYLGHGDTGPMSGGQPPESRLLLENHDGSLNIPLLESQLVTWLNRWHVPAVLLLGCLTAARPQSDQQAALETFIPTSIRGGQGMAQAIVNNPQGVHVAVGMRYLLDEDDALQFLQNFCMSLLSRHPGDVEAAVHAARFALYNRRQAPLNWAAPAVFSAAYEEPLFGFLQTPNRAVKPEVQPERQETTESDTISLKSTPEAQPEQQETTEPDIITPKDFLEAQRIVFNTADPLNELFPRASQAQDEEFLSTLFIPVTLLQGKLSITIDQLRTPKSCILFGRSGYGKTKHRLKVEDYAKGRRALVVNVDFPNSLPRRNRHNQHEITVDCEATIVRLIFEQIDPLLKEQDNQKYRQKIWNDRKATHFLKKVEQTLKRSRYRMDIGFGECLKEFSRIAKLLGHDLPGYILLDGLDEVSYDERTVVTIIRPFMSPTILQRCGFIFKFFVPEAFKTALSDSLRRWPPGLDIYDLPPWSDTSLRAMLDERLETYSRNYSPEKSLGNVNSATKGLFVTCFEDLCDETARAEAYTLLLRAANGSPRQLMQFAGFVIQKHCDRLIMEGLGADTPITLETIQRALEEEESWKD